MTEYQRKWARRDRAEKRGELYGGRISRRTGAGRREPWVLTGFGTIVLLIVVQLAAFVAGFVLRGMI